MTVIYEIKKIIKKNACVYVILSIVKWIANINAESNKKNSKQLKSRIINILDII